MVSDCVAFSSDNVEFNAATPENGNVKFTVTPKMEKDQKPDSFFPRVKMKRGSGTLSTNLHQFSQIRFVEMSVDLWIIFQESGRLACLRGQRASRALYYCCIRRMCV